MILRNEYPRPQFRRDGWQSLNGEWEFDFEDKNLVNCGIVGGVSTLYGLADELEITLKFKDKVIKQQRLSLDGKRTKFNIRLANNAFGFGENSRLRQGSPFCGYYFS